jgi:hypothetical protein
MRAETLRIIDDDIFSIETENKAGTRVKFTVDRKNFDRITITTDPYAGRYGTHGMAVKNEGKSKMIYLDREVINRIDLVRKGRP